MSEESGDVIGGGDEGMLGAQRSFRIIPEGLDFGNALMIAGFLFFLAFELLYLCLPQGIKKMVELLDFNDKKGHTFSYTGCAGLGTLILIIIVKITRSQTSVTKEETL